MWLQRNKQILLNKLVIFIALVFSLGSCVSSLDNDKGNELARVFDNYLYESDVDRLVPENTSHHDSLVLVRNYIDSWVKTQLMIVQAKKNLAIQKLDLDKQLEDYRNSLVIYHYETELINQSETGYLSDCR